MQRLQQADADFYLQKSWTYDTITNTPLVKKTIGIWCKNSIEILDLQNAYHPGQFSVQILGIVG